MEIVILIPIIILVLFLLVRQGYKLRDKSDSSLKVNQHPSSFKKADIEMVNDISPKQNVADGSIDISSADTRTNCQ